MQGHAVVAFRDFQCPPHMYTPETVSCSCILYFAACRIERKKKEETRRRRRHEQEDNKAHSLGLALVLFTSSASRKPLATAQPQKKEIRSKTKENKSGTTANNNKNMESMLLNFAGCGNLALVSKSLKVLGESERANMLANGGALLHLGLQSQSVDVLKCLWAHCVENFLDPRRNERDEPSDDDDDDDEDDEDRKVSFRKMERNFHHVTDVWRNLISGSAKIQRFIDECRAYFHAASH